MDNSKLNNLEAIAIILSITLTHSFLTFPKSIMGLAGSSALLNILYIGIIATLLCLLIYKLLSKFSGLDIIDISRFLGGKTFQRIFGFLFLAYIIFVSSMLLRTFANCLQLVYYPITDLFFIIVVFVLSIPIACSSSSNAVFKTNLVIIPLVIFSIIFLFFANTKYFNTQNIYPIFGNGINATFGAGVTNIFAFGGIATLYLIPPLLSSNKQLKSVSFWSAFISVIYFILTVATILFMFNSSSFTNELMPLYSAVRYIEFGIFFQRLDSVFLLIWILSFFCYLGISFHFCMNIFKKITDIKSPRLVSYPLSFLILGCSLLPQRESITFFLESTIFRYVFLIFSIGICLGILILALIKNKILSKNK